MKKSVLFVDDDPFVLDALKRMLRGMCAEWEMEFVISGEKALERMEQSSVDVVVTDMRMPGMSGAELLDEVMHRYPGTVRIVLSGHADKDLILKCVNSTHQYLSKPCDSNAIKAAVKRARSLDNAAEHERVIQLVGKMGRLPSLPSLYVRIVEELNQSSATIETIGDIVSQDLAMTAQFLKLVNSSYFGLSRPASSPKEAAMYLGVDTIKALVLSIHAFSQFDDLKCPGFKLDALMRHSLNTAGRARKIAELEDYPKKISNESFVGGMLHDIGKLLMAANYPSDYKSVLELVSDGAASHCAAEIEVFGVNHSSVGGYLLGLWGLPLPVVEAIALHHSPQHSSDLVFSALTAVHAANAIEHENADGADLNSDAGLNNDYLDGLGLAHRLEAWRQTCQTASTN